MTTETIKTMDPFILYSRINTELRDKFPSLRALCDYYLLDKKDVLNRLSEFGYEYIGEINQFR